MTCTEDVAGQVEGQPLSRVEGRLVQAVASSASCAASR
jgi:hypothetical protein